MKDTIKFYKMNDLPAVTLLDAHISSFRYKTHAHDDYAIGMTFEGTQCFKCGNMDYRVKKGGIIQINPEEPHDGFAEDDMGYTYKMIYIPRNLLNDLSPDSSSIFRFKETVTYDPHMQRYFMKFLNMQRMSDEMNDGRLYDFIHKVIHWNKPDLDNSYSSAELDLINRSIDFIYYNIDGKLELDDICKTMNVSKYHFIRTFKKVTFRTPYQFILDLKLDKARKDLEQGLELKEIADKYGFYDLSHLIKRFKSAYGITPHKYQKQFK